MVTLSNLGQSFLKSVVARLGTALAVWLLAQGIPQDVVDQFIQAILVLGSVGCDILLVLLFRGKVR